MYKNKLVEVQKPDVVFWFHNAKQQQWTVLF